MEATFLGFSVFLMRAGWWYWPMAFRRRPGKPRQRKYKEQLELKETMSKKKNVKTLDEFVEEQYGKKGTPKRNSFEKGYESFKLGFLIQQARLEKGMTQEELAVKCGTNKGYISKIENDLKEVRISTLQKIVELGLGGQLQLSIKL